MGEMMKHRVSVNYTRRDEAVTKVSTNVVQTPMELASRGLMNFFDDLYPWEEGKTIPESVTVDGQTFTVAEIRAWERERYAQSTKENS